MHHRDAIARHRVSHALRVAHEIRRGDPNGCADQIRNPDFLERHVEGDGKSLVNHVAFLHAQNFVFAAQEMADAAVADSNALGPPGRTGRVDDVGRVGRRHGAACRRRVLGKQILHSPDWHGPTGKTGQQCATRDQSGRLRRDQAVVDALDRGADVERQTCRPAHGNSGLSRQQVRAPRQEQSNHPPGGRAMASQGAADRATRRVQRRVGHDPPAVNQGRMTRSAARGCREKIGETFHT